MDLSVILTIHNKGWIAGTVVDALLKYTATPFELVVVYDGCDDDSRESVTNVLNTFSLRAGKNSISSLMEINTPNIHETRSNNIAMRACSGKYAIIVQDDMVVNEDSWDVRLMSPMKKWEDIFAVSARNAFNLNPGVAKIVDLIGMGYTCPRGTPDVLDQKVFRIRQCINRGPLCLDMDKVRRINYLDEEFAPCDGDDADMCFRAYLQHGWKCGVLPIDYISDIHWGTSRVKSNTSQEYFILKSRAIWRNWSLITSRYGNHFADRRDETRILY